MNKVLLVQYLHFKDVETEVKRQKTAITKKKKKKHNPHS